MKQRKKTFSMEGKCVHEEEGVKQASKPENNSSPAEVLELDTGKVKGHGEGERTWQRPGREGSVGRSHSKSVQMGDEV